MLGVACELDIGSPASFVRFTTSGSIVDLAYALTIKWQQREARKEMMTRTRGSNR